MIKLRLKIVKYAPVLKIYQTNYVTNMLNKDVAEKLIITETGDTLYPHNKTFLLISRG